MMAASWNFTDGVSDGRRERLLNSPTFDVLVAKASAEIQAIKFRVEPGRDPGLTDTGKAGSHRLRRMPPSGSASRARACAECCAEAGDRTETRTWLTKR